jgi:hypothetical protein
MRLVVEVPDDLHARFKAETASRNLKQAAIVRELLDSWLDGLRTSPNVSNVPTNAAGPVTNAAGTTISADEVLRRIRTKK